MMLVSHGRADRDDPNSRLTDPGQPLDDAMKARTLAVPSADRLAAGLGIALCLVAASAQAAGHALKTDGGDLLLPSVDGRMFVHRAGGARVELPLPRTARVSDLRTRGREWFAAAVAPSDGGPSIRVFKGGADDLEVLPSPLLAPVREVAQPIFVADRERIHALVWLAGEAHNQLAVRASRWLGDRWSEPQTVSPPGAGTQIGLATAVLGDGSWLAVWAAFDGQDDEILWSRCTDGVWAQPQPIAENNAVPDITPQLLATPEGALVAWSRFDGNDYRVNIARFDGQAWAAPAVIGPRGSSAPSFSSAAAPYLIYHRADPRAWAVMELDADGRVRREAAIEVADPSRPVIGAVTDVAVTLEWLRADRQAITKPARWGG